MKNKLKRKISFDQFKKAGAIKIVAGSIEIDLERKEINKKKVKLKPWNKTIRKGQK